MDMGDGVKSRYKDVDILGLLGSIVDRYVEYSQSAFEVDREMLVKAAGAADSEDKAFIWTCRQAGTHCFNEREAYIRDSTAYDTYQYYAESPRGKLFVCIVEVTGMRDGKVIGDVYGVDYKQHSAHIECCTATSDRVRLVYEHGECIQQIGHEIVRHGGKRLGRCTAIEHLPASDEAVDALLHAERSRRRALRIGDTDELEEEIQGAFVREDCYGHRRA